MIRLAALLLLLLAPPACAGVPRVVADIAPVQSLAAMVMGDLGAPGVVVTPGASPHGFALRPSQARVLQEADLVVWTGPGLTPWLEKPLAALAPGAVQLRLLDLPATQRRALRDLDEEHAGADDHHHHGPDPHAWLDPENARIWLLAIAEALAEMDGGHAAIYRGNAARAAARIEAQAQGIARQLASFRGRPFVTFHDAFQYFEQRFGLVSAGSVSLGSAAEPGPARIARLRDKVAAKGVACAFSEPQFSPRIFEALGAGGLRVAVLDPLGSTIAAGPELYPELLQAMADAVSGCLAPDG